MSKCLLLHRFFASSQYPNTGRLFNDTGTLKYLQCGFRYCSQVKSKPELLKRNKDKRVHHLEDLTKTIDQLHHNKAELESPTAFKMPKNREHPNKVLISNTNESDITSDNVVSDADAKWNASLRSFSEQLAERVKLPSESRLAKVERRFGGRTRLKMHDEPNLSSECNPTLTFKLNRAELNLKQTLPNFDVDSSKPTSNAGLRSAKSKTRNLLHLRPHVEHEERGTSHFSKTTDVHLSMEILSSYELLILSQASSLPANMRKTFQDYLDTRQSVTSSTSSLALPPSVISVDVEQLTSSPDEVMTSVPELSVPTKEFIQVEFEPSFDAGTFDSKEISFVMDPYNVDSGVKLGELQMEVLTTVAKEIKSKSGLVCTEADIENPEIAKDLIAKVAALLKDSRKSDVIRAIALEQQSRDAMYVEEVSAFVELCIMTNMLKYAHYVLTMGYLRGKQPNKGGRSLRGVRPVRDLPTYNKLMHAWAKQGNVDAIQKLLAQLEDLGIKADLQSYAVVLESLGRQEPMSREATMSCLGKIKKANYNLEDILCESRLVEEDQIYVLKAIRSLNPQFTPKRTSTTSGYTGPLLSHLNTKTVVENPWHGVLTAEEMSIRAARQLQIEMTDQIIVDSILPQPRLTPEILAAKEQLVLQREKWREGLKRGFLTSRRHLHASIDGEMGPSLAPYLRLWNSDTYVDLMLQEVEVLGQDMALYSPTCSVLYHILGNKVYDKYVVQSRLHTKYTEKVLSIYKNYAKEFDAKHLHQNHREMWTDLMRKMEMETFLFASPERWPAPVTKSLGKFLYDIIMSQVKVNVNIKAASRESLSKENKSFKKEIKGTENKASKTQIKSEAEIPAFFTVYRMREGIQLEEVLPHPFLVRLYEDANVTQLTFRPGDLPSLVPPMPWLSYNAGGNLLSTTDLTRSPWLTRKQMDIVKSRPAHEHYPMYDGLNTIGACPWIINKPMLDLIISVFNAGGNNKLDIPENVKLASPLPKTTSDMSIEERLKVLRENKALLKDRKEGYSQWCTELYRLSIANKYRDEVFWFPHNIDFRGRTYPTPPHFNHIGGDVGRCLLMFGKGKVLGDHGLDWLKIHLVNLTGLKKRQSNVERLEFANEIMLEVFDSADNPFTGRGWWQTSDEPWQTLACCKEIANAVRSPKPQEFISHIPVHQDGSFNGMQHYAALGRDDIGAKSVNLQPFATPQDVYSNVVELVEKRRIKEAADGIEIAKSLDGFVRRKIIKQTIMTTVYGVTKFGARTQISGQLRHVPNFSPELIFPSMSYLADKTFQSLHQMFGSMKEIQDWFVLCADIVSRVRQKPMEWETPLGWPVLQPYFKSCRISDKKLGGAFIERPNSLKQKNAFPPNFIHSLDSAHMILTAIHCLRSGVGFVSIHDCFWTHACDVDTMNKICREQFVSLHSQPILEDLSRSFEAKFAYDSEALSGETDENKRAAKEFVNYVLRRTPVQGTFDINKVLESTYFFS